MGCIDDAFILGNHLFPTLAALNPELACWSGTEWSWLLREVEMTKLPLVLKGSRKF